MAEAIRYMLYSLVPASRVPLIIHLAAQGNFVPLTQTALQYRKFLVGADSNGMYLSVTCAEDLPWIKPGEGERMGANTFLGDYRLRQQREACALWPRGEVKRDYAKPVRSDVPVLILTGEWDPVTPPSNGDAIAKGLKNSVTSSYHMARTGSAGSRISTASSASPPSLSSVERVKILTRVV